MNPAAPPTFSECVIGYRAWMVSPDGRLGPIAVGLPWVPGVNVARCFGTPDLAHTVRLAWHMDNGHRVVEAVSTHAAPDPDCDCGLYSLRRPRRRWFGGEVDPGTVVGAVASWGVMQVHATGFRAERACVVTLAHADDADADAVARLAVVAERYGVDLVPLARLEQEASRHGSPLPDDVGPSTAADEPAPIPIHVVPAPDATPSQSIVAGPIGFDGRPLPHAVVPPPGLASGFNQDGVAETLRHLWWDDHT